jgi:hypothetical protein
MNVSKEDLIELAGRITPPSRACSDKMTEQADVLASALNRRMMAREDLISLIGSGNEELMEANHANHFKYIASLASLYDATSMVETIMWVIRAYTAHGFSPQYWDVMLPEAIEVLQHHLPPDDFCQVKVMYDFISQHFEDFVNIAASSPSFFEDISALKDLLDK